METHLPIGDRHGFRGFGHWDRRRDVCPPMDFWGRHRTSYNYNRTTRSSSSSTVTNNTPNPISAIPESVRRGFGDMHLDDWVSPNELIGSILEDDKKMMELLQSGNGQVEPPSSPTPPDHKDVFEVKLNVSDYKPNELKIKTCNGLVSIEGRHEEDTKPEHDWRGMELKGYGHISTHFKRTFTLPKNVLDDQLQCNLTEDGHLILCAPVKMVGPAPLHHSHARLQIMPCCTSAQEDKADMLEIPAPKEQARKA